MLTEPVSIFAKPIPAAGRAGNLIAHELRRAILEGRIEPGDVLLEEQLARELGTSRTPVREALIELRNEGLLETRANRRAVVRAYNDAELRDIYGLRAVLEAHAACLAAERATPQTIRELEASNERFRQLTRHDGRIEELVAENLVFHGIIAEATGVPGLRKMIDQVMVIPRRYRAYAAYTAENRGTVERDHGAIAAAIEEGDGARAASLMKAHVRWTGDVAILAHTTAWRR